MTQCRVENFERFRLYRLSRQRVEYLNWAKFYRHKILKKCWKNLICFYFQRSTRQFQCVQVLKFFAFFTLNYIFAFIRVENIFILFFNSIILSILLIKFERFEILKNLIFSQWGCLSVCLSFLQLGIYSVHIYWKVNLIFVLESGFLKQMLMEVLSIQLPGSLWKNMPWNTGKIYLIFFYKSS